MMPLVLQPEVPSVPVSALPFPPSVWDDLLTVKSQRPSVFVPVLSPSWVISLRSPLFPAVWSCPLPSPSLDLCGQRPGPLCLGQPLYWPLLIVCSQRRALGPGVGWWRLPGTPPPSHCPPMHGKQKIVKANQFSDWIWNVNATACVFVVVFLNAKITVRTCIHCCWSRTKIKSFYFYLIYEGVVNKFTGKVFGGVSWKFQMKYFSYKNLQ